MDTTQQIVFKQCCHTRVVAELRTVLRLNRKLKEGFAITNAALFEIFAKCVVGILVLGPEHILSSNPKLLN